MRIIIDIPEDAHGRIVRPDRIFTDDDINDVVWAVYKGTPIPDNATNDDVLKALFDERGYMGIHDRMMHTKWLFAPYQKGGKE